jgi:hypothetical protein
MTSPEKQEQCHECGHVHQTDFYCLVVLGPGDSCGCVVGVRERYEALKNCHEKMLEALKDSLSSIEAAQYGGLWP